MDFIKVDTSRTLGTTVMNEDTHQFCAALEAALRKAAPDAVGYVHVKPIYGPDSVFIRIVNCPRSISGQNCNADNNLARFTVENIGSPKLKLARERYHDVPTQTDINMRGKSARQELVIKSIVKFFCEISEIPPSIWSATPRNPTHLNLNQEIKS